MSTEMNYSFFRLIWNHQQFNYDNLTMENSTTNVVGAAEMSNEQTVSLVYSDQLFPVVVSLLFLLTIWTVTGNIMIVIALLKFKKLKTINNMLIGNLAICDALLGFTVLPFSAMDSSMGYWVFGEVWCNIWLAIDVLYCTSSIWSLTAIAFDRFTATFCPLWYRQRDTVQARIVFYIIFVWTMSILVSISPYIGWIPLDKNYQEEGRQCMLFSHLSFVIYSAMCSFFIPFSIMILLYITIFVVLIRNSMKRAKTPRKQSTKEDGQITSNFFGTKSTMSTLNSSCQLEKELRLIQSASYYDLSSLGSGSSQGSSPSPSLQEFDTESEMPLTNESRRNTMQFLNQTTLSVPRLNHRSVKTSRRCSVDQLELPRTASVRKEREQLLNSSANENETLTRADINITISAASRNTSPTASMHHLSASNNNSSRRLENKQFLGMPKRQESTHSSDGDDDFDDDESSTATEPKGAAVSMLLGSFMTKIDHPLSTTHLSPIQQPDNNPQNESAPSSPTESVIAPLPILSPPTSPRSARKLSKHMSLGDAPGAMINGTISSTMHVSMLDPASGKGTRSSLFLRTSPSFGRFQSTLRKKREKARRILKKLNERERRATKRMALIIACFTACWMPFFCIYLVRGLCGEKACNVNNHVMLTVIWLGYSNSGLNPLLYTLTNRDFRNAFKRMLGLSSSNRGR